MCNIIQHKYRSISTDYITLLFDGTVLSLRDNPLPSEHKSIEPRVYNYEHLDNPYKLYTHANTYTRTLCFIHDLLGSIDIALLHFCRVPNTKHTTILSIIARKLAAVCRSYTMCTSTKEYCRAIRETYYIIVYDIHSSSTTI